MKTSASGDAEVSRERLAFLAEASAALAESLDLEATLSRVADLAVPRLGDWCVIHLVEEDGVRVAAAAHTDPDCVALLLEAHERYPTDVEAQDGVGAVIRSGKPLRHQAVTDETLTTIARDAGHLDLLRRLEFGSIATIPLTARQRRIGAITIATARGTVLDDAAVATAEELAPRASIAIDNARLHHQLQAAHDKLELQAVLLSTQAEAGMEGQVVVSPAGEMVSFNQRFAEMWGLSTELLDRRSDHEALAYARRQVADPDGFDARVRELYAEPRPSRDEVVLLDGRVFDRYGAPLVRNGEPLGYAWYFRDVTDQKRAERALSDAGANAAALARILQKSLLPPQLPEVPGIDMAARYHPGGEGSEVGGDFYDVFGLGDGSWGVVMGDVCGKGPEAAAVTALARYTIRAAAVQTPSPASTLATLNEALLREAADGGSGLFVTAAHCRLRVGIDGVEVTVACGGHPLPLVRRRDGTVEAVGHLGTLLGVLPTLAVREARTVLGPGDAIVLVTDGVLEARPVDQYGEERLFCLLRGTVGLTAERMAAAIEQMALDHQKGATTDDIAVLVLAVTV